MKLFLHKTTIPPREIDARQAGQYAVEKKHLIAIGDPELTEHKNFLSDILDLLSGQCAYLYIQVGDIPAPALPNAAKMMISPVTTTDRAYSIIFVPDTVESRAVLIALISHYAPSMLSSLVKIPNPIVMLDGSTKEESERLQKHYAIIANGLYRLGTGSKEIFDIRDN